MRIKSLLVAIAGVMALSSGAAQAQSSDAFTTFDGTQGAGSFYYGDLVDANTFAFYAANTNCFIDGSVCLQRDANHDVPGVAKGGSPAFQYGSVNVPSDRLLIHPANDPSLASAFYFAPTDGTYQVTATFNTQDVSPSGVDLFLLQAFSNAYPFTVTALASLSSATPSYTYSALVHLNPGDIYGFGVGNGGVYYNDSTGLNFSVAAVPEPATWGMLILGFGVAGAAVRRKVRLSEARFTAKIRTVAAEGDLA